MSAPTYPLLQTPITTNFSITAKQIQLTDLYGSTGAYLGTYNIPNAGIKGVFKITAPDGTVIYNNTSYTSPDIVGSTATWTKNISLPTNSDGSLVQGVYTAVLATQITDGVHSAYIVTNTATYNFVYTSPAVSITQTVDCVSPLFTTVDATSYIVNLFAPTTLTRTLTLDYPFGSAGQGHPLTSSGTTISTGVFYNGTQTTTVSTVLIYTLSATGAYVTFTISDTVTGAKEVLVDCTFICAISCCIQALETRLSNAANGVNNVLYEQYQEQFTLVMSYVELALLAISCGQSSKVNGYIAKIQTIAECTSGCDCATGSPSLVVGLGGSSVNVVVASGGSPIIVTSNVVSGTTTYTITLDSSFVSTVNNSYNTTLTSSDASVAIATSGSNPKNYDLSVTFPTVQNRIEMKVTVTYASPVSSTADVTIGIGSVLVTGTKFQTPTIALDDPTNPSWLILANVIKVTNFFTGAADNNYKIILSDNAGLEGTTLALQKNLPLTLRTVPFGRNDTAGVFYFQTVLSSGVGIYPPTNGNMQSVIKEITLVISE